MSQHQEYWTPRPKTPVASDEHALSELAAFAEMGGATRQCVELLGAGAFDVRSWDGGSRCTKRADGVFLKGIEPAFRIHLDNGQFFDCSRNHRVLTTEGWLSLCQLIQNADGLHCSRTIPGSKASCDRGDHLDGARLQGAQGIYPTPTPSREYAQELLPYREMHAGGTVPKHECTRAYPIHGQSSTLDDPIQIAALCAQFEDPTSYIDALWTSRRRRDVRQFCDELSLVARDQKSVHPWQSACGDLWGSEYPDADSTHSASLWSDGAGEQWRLASGLQFLASGSHREAQHTEIFFPFETIPLFGGAKIQSIVTLGVQPILDFTVENTHCYESGGVIHHNTGKTDAGAYEVTLHLTRRA